MRQERQPVKEGDICWDPTYAERMLSPISQVGPHAVDWFLATHSPITSNDRIGHVEEQKLFADLLAASKPETLVVVKGDPGAGKSQLINWLKLRFDDAIARGERSGMGDRRLRSVLIRRESGSLKDALRQLVDQLSGYERYLAKIQAAIADVGGDAATRRLYTEMHHCLFATRNDAPKHLKYLDQVFNDNAAIERLCRPGGTIDRNIKRLIEESDVGARESLPPFTANEFDFPFTARLGFDESLRDRLADDEALRNQAAAWANEHLRLAIAGLTGLRGHTLNEIFRDIREEMQRRGEALAIFVEDVSTLSVLDEELVNALQPLNDPALCPLLSVLGMTEPAYDRLPDNLKGRVDRVLELSADSSLKLSEANGEATDRFVARYLNSLRAGSQQIRLLADDVRSHGDQQSSACDECPQKSKCFGAFGSVRIGGAEIGLYPLAPGASGRLLANLRTETGLRTPRTLLQYVVRPLLKGMASEFRGATVDLSVQPRSPRDLNVEQDRLLVGWTAEQKGRISYLLYYWTGEDSLAEGAARLAPMLPWFRHPRFGRHVESPPVKERAERSGGATDTTSLMPPLQATPTKYEEAVARLDEWFQQERPLDNDSEFRRMLAGMIIKSLPLDDVRAPSQRVRLLSSAIDAGNIAIDGMIRKPKAGSHARFTFRRSAEVYQLLKDLVGFEYLGSKSWHFQGGEEARRRYAHWLTQHSNELVLGFDVTKGDRESALRVGIRFLRLAYRFSMRKDLPSDTGGAVEAITSFNPPSVFTLSPRAKVLNDSLPQRVQEVRMSILEELAVKQGNRGGLNYIDSRPLIEHLAAMADDLSLGETDVLTAVDYPGIGRLASSDWQKLEAVLKEEQQTLSTRLFLLDPLLRQWRLSTDSIPQALREYFESARAVIKACEGASESLGNEGLQTQIRDLTPAAVTRLVAPIERALDVLDKAPAALLALGIGEVDATINFVLQVDIALRRLQLSLGQRLSDVVTEAEVDADRKTTVEAIRSLMMLAAIDETMTEANV